MPNSFTDNPQASHTLANDQPNIQNNFRYIQGALGKDHQIVFNDSDTGTTFEGRHIGVSLKDNGASPAFPGDGTDSYVWSHSGNLFCRTSTAGPFQITTTNTASNFGGNANYQAGPPSTTGGWTFLPGGLIMQYGNVTTVSPGGTVTVDFAFPFPSVCISVVATPNTSSSIGGGNHDWTVRAVGTSSFDLRINGNYNAGDTFYFIAIGK